jgi:hypothetical protein
VNGGNDIRLELDDEMLVGELVPVPFGGETPDCDDDELVGAGVGGPVTGEPGPEDPEFGGGAELAGGGFPELELGGGGAGD